MEMVWTFLQVEWILIYRKNRIACILWKVFDKSVDFGKIYSIDSANPYNERYFPYFGFSKIF